MKRIKPRHLEPGDTVGVVSPSWGAAGLFPHRLDNGIRALEGLGFTVRVGRHARGVDGWVSASAEARAADINEMFDDPEVGAIIAAIGGDHSCELLGHLDFDVMAQHPKVLMGYSDVTVLNVAIWAETGLTTFNGPAVITDFAEHPEMLGYTRDAFQKAVMSTEPIGRVPAAGEWTEEILDWGEKLDLRRPRMLQASPGWTPVNEGTAEGFLVGGCIESLQHLRGTRFWPDVDGAILFVETSEEAPAPASVAAILADYGNMGVLDAIAGLLVGRPMGYTPDDRRTLVEVVHTYARRYGIPAIADMDFGHTAPQMVLPIGCRAAMTVATATAGGVAPRAELDILEAAVR